MSTGAALIVLGVAAVSGVALVVCEVLQPAPSLARTLRRLHRESSPVDASSMALLSHVRTLPVVARALPSPAGLALAGVTAEQHLLHLVAAAGAGAGTLATALVVLATAGVVAMPTSLAVGVPVVGLVIAPLVVQTIRLERIRGERDDMRHQLSAFLDVVTMLLAANDGHESAMEHAATAGDGRLFRELRRRMREAGAAGDSFVTALAATGTAFGLPELEQVAATAALSSAEGSPVARTLAAKCATLRSTLAGEQETEARLRTSRLTPPIVGMALIFMSLVIYPALAAA